MIDFVTRSDSAVKPGGDSVQVQEYSRHLLGRGFSLREVPFSPSMQLRPGAIMHVFNVDRPYEFLTACRIARGHRIVVSPIHHNISRVRAMRAADQGRGVVSVASRIVPEVAREWAVTMVRCIRSATNLVHHARAIGTAVRLLVDLPAIWQHVGSELDRADAVALLANGEGQDLRLLTGWRGTNAVLVPNGRPPDIDVKQSLPWRDREKGSILVVGRIEPRKRQLEVARAADALGISVTFVGQRANAGDAYTRDFDALVGSSAFVSYAGALNRSEVLERMGQARVLLNASWVEVQSLVDIEAAAMGCAVVSGPSGHSREWLGDAVRVVPDDDLVRLLLEAQQISNSPQLVIAALGYDWTWSRSSERLGDLYVSIIQRA